MILVVCSYCVSANGGAVFDELIGDADAPYEMRVFNDAPIENSTVSIEYPYFIGSEFNILNAVIYAKLECLVRYAYAWYEYTSHNYLDMECAVTLMNSKAVSIVFWGKAYREDRHDDSIFTLNIDLSTLKEIKLAELYNIDANFENAFFANAYQPTAPDTSPYDRDFYEYLRYQTREYNTTDPFTFSEQFPFFLKPNAIVISIPMAHAGGNHFEAQLDFDVIVPYYKLNTKLWEN
jgi:hypothetical protein